jgi:citrate synthase
MHWGMPVLESALTLITDDGRLLYRGRDATALARSATLEQVAALLWMGDMARAEALFAAAPDSAPYLARLARLGGDVAPLARAQAALALASADDLAALDLDRAPATGVKALRLVTAALTGSGPSGLPVAELAQRAWLPERPDATPLIQAALILCADHELNVSAFTARVIASADANPYLTVTGGLAALQGFKHGGNTLLVERLLAEATTPERAPAVCAAWLRRGERLPGFGHRLYPEIDPRARVLLTLLADRYPDAPAVRLTDAVITVAHHAIDRRPNIDLALVTLTRTLGLPDGTALLIFAVGRTVGWLAHAFEQYRSDELIRPRALYVGELAEDRNRPDTMGEKGHEHSTELHRDPRRRSSMGRTHGGNGR